MKTCVCKKQRKSSIYKRAFSSEKVILPVSSQEPFISKNSSKQICRWILMWNDFGLFHWRKRYYGMYYGHVSWPESYICFLRNRTRSAGRYTGSYRIPVFIFLMIWIFKIPQYRCYLNHVRNATLFERGLFSLLHCGEDTAVCVTKRESSETEAVELIECDDTEELIHNIHRPLPSAPTSHTRADFSTIFSNFQTLLAAFFHRIYKLPNLATFLDKP